MIDLTRHARGIPPGQVTVPRMFFSASPSWNRELYQAIQQEMQRDYLADLLFPGDAGRAVAGAVPARSEGVRGPGGGVPQ